MSVSAAPAEVEAGPSGTRRAALARATPALLLGGGAAVSLAVLPVLSVAANRLVPGFPVGAGALGIRLLPCLVLLAAGSVLLAVGRLRVVALAAFAAALVLLVALLGDVAAERVAGQPSATRARLASGAWITGILLAAAMIAAALRVRRAWIGWLTAGTLLAALALLAASGRLDALSLVVEYRARRETVQAAFLDHLGLCGAALALAVAAALLLRAWSRARAALDLAISGIQVVPAVALLGGLVALISSMLAALPGLRATGLAALGPAPAILAIAAYLMLPLWRGLDAALAAPDPATIDAATALGLSPGQILRRVRLPLGAPILVGALRVAAIQSVGLATLGALVGAGGLGTVVFDGMAQFAPDLILLGAVPVIGLSIGLDRVLSLVEDGARRRWR